MKDPLVVFVTAFSSAFFAFSWFVVVGYWLGFLGSDRLVVLTELLRLAYAGAGLSVIFLSAAIAVKLRR